MCVYAREGISVLRYKRVLCVVFCVSVTGHKRFALPLADERFASFVAHRVLLLVFCFGLKPKAFFGPSSANAKRKRKTFSPQNLTRFTGTCSGGRCENGP